MKRNTARGAAVLGRQLVLAALAALVAGLTPGRAAAHDLRADVNPATDPIRVEAGYDDGTPADEIIRWSGRTLERISVFGELQTPLLPARWLPHPFKAVELDLAARTARLCADRYAAHRERQQLL